MNEYFFNPCVLTPEYVKKYGTLYLEDVFCCDDCGEEVLFDKDPMLGGKPFTGLLYELDNNGNLRYYKYYTKGFSDGEYVTCYDTGAIASYCIMRGAGFDRKLYEWYKNGRLKRFREIDENRRHIKTIEFDDNGDIIFLMEKGKVKVENKMRTSKKWTDG